MADIRPFRAVRPRKEKAFNTASWSFEEFQNRLKAGDLYQYHASGYFIYELKSDERIQRGIVACASIDDYLNQIIKNHEDINDERDEEKVNRIREYNIQTESVILAYHDQGYIKKMIAGQIDKAPLYQFTTSDGIQHSVWSIDDFSKVSGFKDAFVGISDLYVVSGNDVAASAVEIGLKRREENPDYDGTEEYNYFMCMLLPYSEVKEGGSWVVPKLQSYILSYTI